MEGGNGMKGGMYVYILYTRRTEDWGLVQR